jgi:hypothetical protein
MTRKALTVACAAIAAAMFGTGIQVALAGAPHQPAHGKYEPVLNPKDFVRVINNPYYPLPLGRTLIYRGIKDGKTQIDRVHITRRTKMLEGIRATTVTDVSTHNGKLLEKTTDWYAQDKQGNVWYLGEATAAFPPGGGVDHSGSWQAGVKDAEPGLVMKANPQVPEAYRQEFLTGQAEDAAWIVERGGSATVPLGTLHHVLTTLEFTRLEPDVVDRKVYAPGIGVIIEQSLHGPIETAEVVSVRG